MLKKKKLKGISFFKSFYLYRKKKQYKKLLERNIFFRNLSFIKTRPSLLIQIFNLKKNKVTLKKTNKYINVNNVKPKLRFKSLNFAKKFNYISIFSMCIII